MSIKRCAICNEEFCAKSGRYNYCSDECRKIGKYNNNKKYIERCKAAGKAYWTNYAYKPVVKHCKKCGTVLPDGRQTWCLDCLLLDYKLNKSPKAYQRLSLRGFTKTTILEEIRNRR